MKDIKVIVGPDTGRMGDDHRSLTPATLVVRNQDTNGRRLGIFTRDGKAVAGQQLNHADALHTPKEVLNVPQGYGSGVEVSLSPKRDYFKVFGISQSWVPEQHLAGFRREMYRENGMDESLNLHVSDTIPDLSKLRTTLTTGDMAIGAEKGLSALNSFVSFTMVFGGRNYHIGLDLAKHPAHVTADLNYRLNRIHPQLRGFVNAKPTADWEYREIEFHITPPDGLEVIFPITTFGVVEDLSVETPQGRTFKSVHLNDQLSNAIMVTKAKGIQAVSNTVTSVNVNAQRSSLSAMLDNPYLVSLDTFGKVVEGTLELHTGMVTVPASAFKTWDRDERLCFSILKLERKYVDGKAYRIQSIKYVDESGRALPFDEEHADLFLLRGVDEAGLPTVPTVFINDILEREVDELEGYSAPTASQIQFAETGGLNEDNAAAYIALFPRPSEDNSNSIFFRNSNLATYIQIQYVLDYVDELPQVKMNDFGRLDYHRIKTEDHGFLPVSFTAKPITGWGLEFVVEGQEERYLSHKLEHDEETNSTLMLTHGTVGEAVVLSDLDYDQVLAPTVDIPFYHLYDEIGAQTWLNFNLLPSGVVTSTATSSEKARFEVVFPRTEMVTTIEHITQTLIANQVEGEVLLKGKMANESYTIQPHVHALTTEWSFTINGTSVTPARAVDFNKSTGEWSVPIAIADLVANGPGDYTLRVSLTSEYPWLKTPEVYSVPLLFVVMSSVQGVEDDVTFIGSNLFDKNVDGTESSAYRLVDLDSGEILATGANPFALRQDAVARGLVDIDLIFGQLYEDEPEISCEGAPSNVDLDIDGEWDLEIGGVIVGSGTMEELKPTALEHDVVITTECIPTPETLLRSITGELEEGSVMRLAYQVTDGNGAVKTESATYTIGETPNGESDINFGYEPLILFTYGSGAPWNDERFFTEYANNPYYSDNWKDSCILGETRITGELWGYNLGAFTGSEPQTANLKIVIDGVEHVLTTSHLFKSAADGSEAELRVLMQAFATQLEALGFTTTLVPGFTYLTGTPQEYRGTHLRIHYTVGQFNAVSVAQQLIIGNGYTPYWKEVYFDEECRVRKNGLNSASEYTALVRGQGKEDFGNGFIFDPRTVKFDTCANLNVPLEPGEIDYFLTLKVVDNESQEVSSLETPLILHSCGRNGNLG